MPFNYDRLKDESLVYDTEPACRAVVVARSMKPEIELDFFKDV
jgi:protein-disulfide isomerase-like protein with CxxC motif